MAGYLATPVVTALVLWWLLRGGEDEAPVESGELVLRYSRSVAWLGVALMALGVGITVLIARSAGMGAPLDLLAVLLVMGGPGLAFILIQRREHLVVGLDGLEARGAFGRVRRLGWAEVERVTFGSGMSALTFHGSSGSKVRASVFYVGIVALADVVERRLAHCGGAPAVRQLRSYRQMGGAPKR